MLNFSNIQLHLLAIHFVGNKHREEDNFISNALFDPHENLAKAMLHYFLKPFKKLEEQYRFQHLSDVQLNEMYNYAKNIFENPDNFLETSQHILKYLYSKSEHPNIKSGEVYVTLFRDVLIDDEIVDAVGVFKSERKNNFFNIAEGHSTLTVQQFEGVNIEKLDKGCLILNTAQSDGFRVLSVDNNNYDTAYWIQHFLGVSHVENENFHTRQYLEMVNEFAGEVIAPQADKKEQIQFMTDSVNYFASNEVFDFEDFTEKVVPQDENLKEEFKNYQKDFALDEVDSFAISSSALKTVKRKMKSLIKLDTDIQIKLDMNNPESSKSFIEKGFDEERNMYFYKIYFNEEL